jgi:hypothetical protein
MEPAGILPRVYAVGALLGMLAPVIVTAILALPYIFVLQIALEPYPSARAFQLLLIGVFLLWLLAIAFANLAIGLEFGKRWPALSWRWGLWISLPFVILILIGDYILKSADPWPSPWVLLTGCLMLSTLPACVGARLGVRRAKARDK